ncbi:MAG: hypothetical protein QF450_03590 [Rhodospirillales bacterium]|nr:hypothetical protein [Rhodospirillales bacterium]
MKDEFDLGNRCPLNVGFGMDTHFAAVMSDLRPRHGALDDQQGQIRNLARREKRLI